MIRSFNNSHGVAGSAKPIQRAARCFSNHSDGFFPRDRIHIQRSCLKKFLMNIRACSECSKKIFFKGLRPWIHPVFCSFLFFFSPAWPTSIQRLRFNVSPPHLFALFVFGQVYFNRNVLFFTKKCIFALLNL